MRPGAEAYETSEAAVEAMAADGAGAAIIGTPDDLIKAIREMQTLTGGFGTVIGFANDWANRDAQLRSWDLVARYVILTKRNAGWLSGVSTICDRKPRGFDRQDAMWPR